MEKVSKDRMELLPQFQNFLLARKLETPMVYTHVLRNMSNAPQSPLDTLYKEQKS
jgi:hypothetical protein